MEWPAWWSWDVELTPHLVKRMADRQFDEVDLRTMLETAVSYREDDEFGRFVIETRHGGRVWEVIVEPATSDEALIVITAFPAD